MSYWVQITTDEFPGVGQYIEHRRVRRMDRYDEWWDGIYRVVTGPTVDHGRFLLELAVLLHPLVEAEGLHMAAPVNIGVDRQDCRVPAIGIYEPATPRTSSAFLQRALMVVEVLLPGVRPGEKLDFYRAHGVCEHLEIDLRGATVELLGLSEFQDWEQTDFSEILPGLAIVGSVIVCPSVSLDVHDFRPQ